MLTNVLKILIKKAKKNFIDIRQNAFFCDF